MNIPSPLLKKTESVRKSSDNLTTEELQKFMKKHGFGEKEFADFFGVTIQGVRLWLSGQREISKTNTRLIRMLDKHSQLIPIFKDL